MRLEVIVENEEPLVFPLNRPKIFIGSHESCDIVLTADGVSRKHIAVICEEESYFVIDQGSTNGTYINEERLVPGRRSEFTSFFPVRLGDNVLLTLLSDEEVTEENLSSLSSPSVNNKSEINSAPSESPKAEATRVISLKDLKTASTTNLVKKKLEKQAIKKTPGKKVKKKTAKKFSFSPLKILSVIILAGGFYINVLINKMRVKTPEVPVAKVGEIIKQDKSQTKKASQIGPSSNAIRIIAEEELTPPATIKNYFNDFKCSTDLEKYFCTHIVGANELPWGAIQVGMKFYILVDSHKIKPMVDAVIAASPKVLKNLLPNDYNDLMHLIFWTGVFPQEYKQNDLKDLTVFAAFFDSPEKIQSVSAILPENLPKLLLAMKGNKGMEEIRQRGIIRLRKFKEYYSNY